MQALCLAVLSDQGKTKPARIAGRGDRYGLSVEPYFAAAASDARPENRLEDFRPTRAKQACDAENLALVHIEADAVEHGLPAPSSGHIQG
jgi:hypothetical protein